MGGSPPSTTGPGLRDDDQHKTRTVKACSPNHSLPKRGDISVSGAKKQSSHRWKWEPWSLTKKEAKEGSCGLASPTPPGEAAHGSPAGARPSTGRARRATQRGSGKAAPSTQRRPARRWPCPRTPTSPVTRLVPWPLQPHPDCTRSGETLAQTQGGEGDSSQEHQLLRDGALESCC